MIRTAIVIGAGITGVAAALQLVRDGWRVTLLDPRAPGDPGQTSFGNAGLLARASIVPVQVPGLIWRAPRMLLDPDAPLFLRPSHLPRLLPWLTPFLRNGSRTALARIVPAIFALTHDTLEQHRALAAGTPASALIAGHAYTHLFRDRREFARAGFGFGLKSDQGITWDERDGASLRAADPGLGPAYGFGATFSDHGWITDPGGYVAALAGALQSAGGEVLRAEARDIRPGPGHVTVATEAATLAADRVVIAAGIWSKPLAERLGLRAPLETERGYHLMLRGASHRPPHPYMLSASAIVATPMRDGLRFAGLVEFGGLDAPPSDAPIRLIRRAVLRAFPGLTWDAEEAWMGHRPTTPDSLPMVGRIPGAPGVICAFGGQHLGLTVGPRIGRLVAEIAADRMPDIDLAPYAPDRFRAADAASQRLTAATAKPRTP